MKRLDPHINEVIWVIFFANGSGAFALGLAIPFITVFAKNMEGGSVEIAGIAAGMFPIIAGVSQIIGGWALDRSSARHPKYLFYFFLAQKIANALYLALMAFVQTPWQLLALQAGRGIFAGFTLSSGNVIQNKYIDRGKEGLEWGINGAMANIFYGLAGISAGFIIAYFGFQALFFIGSFFYFAAAIFALRILKKYTAAVNRPPQ